MAFTIEHQRNAQWQFRDVIKGQCWAHNCNQTVESVVENTNLSVKSGAQRLGWPETIRIVKEALRTQGWHLRLLHRGKDPECVLICPDCWDKGMDEDWRYEPIPKARKPKVPTIKAGHWIFGNKRGNDG